MANLDGANITREQFLLHEMRVVCQLHLDGFSNQEIVDKARNENFFQYPTERSVNRIARACCGRIDSVGSNAIVNIIANGMLNASVQANLYAMMCTYPLVRDFMINEVGKHFLELNYQLGSIELGAYITRLQSEYENMAKMTESTLAKIKQVLRKCLIECGMLTNARSQTLIPIFIDPDVRIAIEAKGDFQALPAFNAIGVI